MNSTSTIIRVRVPLFSHLKHAFGQDELELSVPLGSTVKDLEEIIREKMGEKNRQIPLRAAVNQTYVLDNPQLADGDEVVFIPPVQGGIK